MQSCYSLWIYCCWLTINIPSSYLWRHHLFIHVPSPGSINFSKQFCQLPYSFSAFAFCIQEKWKVDGQQHLIKKAFNCIIINHFQMVSNLNGKFLRDACFYRVRRIPTVNIFYKKSARNSHFSQIQINFTI